MLNGPFVQELLDVILLPATLATIKIPGHSKLDSLEAQENHFADISIRNATLKGTKSNQISVTIQRNISPNDNLGNWLEKPNSWPQKRKSKIENTQFLVWKKEKLLIRTKYHPSPSRNSKILIANHYTCIKQLVYSQNDSIHVSVLVRNINKATKKSLLYLSHLL